MIYLNPYLSLNPFPPPTLPATAFIPSPTPTVHLNLPPTWTPTFTLLPTDTHTPEPTATDFPTATLFTMLTPSHTPTSTNPPSGYIYEIQAGIALSKQISIDTFAECEKNLIIINFNQVR